MIVDIRGVVPMRPKDLGISDSTLPPSDTLTIPAAVKFGEWSHRLVHGGYKRVDAIGAPFLQKPLDHLKYLKNEMEIGHWLTRGKRGAEGERYNVFNNTQYGKMHELARKNEETQAHGISHETRLGDWAERILLSKEFRLSDVRLYLIPHLWISHHDSDQLDGEQAQLPDPKHGHDFAAALQTLVFADTYMHEAFISPDDARLITGVTAGLMLFHDEPLIQQKLLDATESDTDEQDGFKPYKTVNGMREYFSAEMLYERFLDPKQAGVDLFALQDWQIADLTKLIKSKKGYVIPGKTPFGLSQAFEQDFKFELERIGQGERPANQGRILTPEEGEAHALVPERLLAKMQPDQRRAFREDAMFLGDMLRIFDQIDMVAPPDLAMTRKWAVAISSNRPLVNGDEEKRVYEKPSKLPPKEDSDLGRGAYETYSLTQQIKSRDVEDDDEQTDETPKKYRQKSYRQKRRALGISPDLRKLVHSLHEANIRMHADLFPILMRGGRPNVPDEEENRALIDQRIHEIFGKELMRVTDEMLRKKRIERRLSPRRFQGARQYAHGAQGYLREKGYHKQAEKLHRLTLTLDNTAENTMHNLDKKQEGQGLIRYPQEFIDSVHTLSDRLLERSREDYRNTYHEEPPDTTVHMPFRSYHTLNTEPTPAGVITIRRHVDIPDNQTKEEDIILV